MKPDPFKTQYGVVVDAADRIRKVKGFTYEQCQAALEQARTYQKTVLDAIERRMRQTRVRQTVSSFEKHFAADTLRDAQRMALAFESESHCRLIGYVETIGFVPGAVFVFRYEAPRGLTEQV